MKENKSKFKVNKIFYLLFYFIFFILNNLKIYKILINFNYIYFIFFIIKSNIKNIFFLIKFMENIPN